MQICKNHRELIPYKNHFTLRRYFRSNYVRATVDIQLTNTVQIALIILYLENEESINYKYTMSCGEY